MGNFKDLVVVLLSFTVLAVVFIPNVISKVYQFLRPCEEPLEVPYDFHLVIGVLLALIAYILFTSY